MKLNKPYLTTEWIDEYTGATGYLVIQDVLNGFSAGGIRMRSGLEKEEVHRLAQIMSVKMAGLGMAIGGAKGGINFPSHHPESKGVLERYLQAHLPFIKENWLTSEDLGTREEDIVEILRKFGVATSVQAYIDKSENKESLFRELTKAMTVKYDGIHLTDLVTGFGVAAVTVQGLKYLGKETSKSRVSIQGFGSVGASAAKFLFENGVKVVGVSDVNGVVYCKDGLDIPLLLSLKDPKGNINTQNLPTEYELLSGNEWLSLDVDVLIPAAIADAINENNVNEIQASLIVEGANLPVTQEAEKLLLDKGVPVIPDFIANSGGAGLFVSILHANVKGEPEEIFTFLDNQLTRTANKILAISKDEKILVREAARRLVK